MGLWVDGETGKLNADVDVCGGCMLKMSQCSQIRNVVVAGLCVFFVPPASVALLCVRSFKINE